MCGSSHSGSQTVWEWMSRTENERLLYEACLAHCPLSPSSVWLVTYSKSWEIDTSEVLTRPCFSIHLLLFQVISSPEVHMPRERGRRGNEEGTHSGRWVWSTQHILLKVRDYSYAILSIILLSFSPRFSLSLSPSCLLSLPPHRHTTHTHTKYAFHSLLSVLGFSLFLYEICTKSLQLYC